MNAAPAHADHEDTKNTKDHESPAVTSCLRAFVALCVSVTVLSASLPRAAGLLRSPPARRSRAAELVELLGHAVQPALQPADANHAGQRQESRAAVDLAGAFAGEVRSDGARGGRRALHAAGAAGAGHLSGGRARRRDRPAVLDLRIQAGGGSRAVLRPREPRPVDSRRHAVPGHHRRAPAGDRREDRPCPVEHRGGARRGQVRHHPRAHHRQGQGHRRRGGRRPRRARVHRRVRREDRQGALALLHDSGPRRTGSTRPGRASRGRPAARRSGTAAPTTQRRTSSTSAPAIRGRTATAASASATTCTATASSRSIPIPAG